MEDLVPRVASFVVPLLPGFFLGFLLGRFARNALGTALLIAGVLAGAVFLLGHFGADVSIVKDWLSAGSSWAGEQLSGMKQYLAAIVPPIAALGFGFKFGFGRG